MSELQVKEIAVGGGSATGNPRNKVALKPGRSLMDWIRLGHSGKDLTGLGLGGKLLQVTYQELQRHNRQDDAWISIKGNVYNVTRYMEYHPGGVSELMRGVGTDATKLFNETHQWVNYESMLQKCLVGRLVGLPSSKQPRLRYPSRKPKFPNDKLINSVDVVDRVIRKQPEDYYRCTLSAKYRVNHNTKLFKLKLPLDVNLEIPVGHHVQIRTTLEGVEVTRNYTPVVSSLDSYLENSTVELVGLDSIYLMIKIYEGGSLTPHLDSVALGEEIEINSRILGSFDMDTLKNCKRLFLLAAGTGLTPMIRLLLTMLSPSSTFGVSLVKLVFFNRNEEDILWREDFDKLVKFDSRFEVVHVLSEADENWTGLTGRVTGSLLENTIQAPFCVEDFCCICGPNAFTDETLRILEDFNFPSSRIHPFKS